MPLDNKCYHKTKRLRCTHSSFSLLTSPQLDCLRTWPSMSRCLLNSEGPPKGPNSFVALQIISHRDWPMSWRSPSIERINEGRWRHDPLRLARIHSNKESEAQPCKECFGQQHPYERPSLPHRAAFNGYHHSGSPGHLLKLWCARCSIKHLNHGSRLLWGFPEATDGSWLSQGKLGGNRNPKRGSCVFGWSFPTQHR